ncbi:MAG: hypothetical protein PHY90_07065, partial [Desulfitobacteriaceae bacterium]|nr:hypothetical protein [Desulfitobacteriaceae bacterium]
MLNYQKKWRCKALPMLLAVAIILTAPIGITQAYALWDRQLAVTDSQGGLPLGVSEETESSEVPDSVTQISVGYVLLANNDPEPTAEQIASSHGNIPGATVITWAQQTLVGSELPITLSGAQDNTDYDFYVVCWEDDAFSEVKHLDVKTPDADPSNPGSLTLAPPTGLQWDTTDEITAKWNAVDNATSYAVTLWNE